MKKLRFFFLLLSFLAIAGPAFADVTSVDQLQQVSSAPTTGWLLMLSDPAGQADPVAITVGNFMLTIPPTNLATGVTGNLGVIHLNGGSGASSTTFWRGDGTWASAQPLSSVLTTLAGTNPFTQGSNITFTGTWPNITISATGGGSNYDPTNVSITGGSIDNVTLGASTPITYLQVEANSSMIISDPGNNGQLVVYSRDVEAYSLFYAGGVALEGGGNVLARWTQKSNNEVVYSYNVDPLNDDTIDNIGDDAYKFGMQGVNGYRGLAFQSTIDNTWNDAQTVWSVDYAGNTRQSGDIYLGNGSQYLQLANGAQLREGSFDNGFGGNYGISLFCSVNYELNWQAGRLALQSPVAEGTAILMCDNNNSLALQNGTFANTLNIYGSYTDGSNDTILTLGSFDGTSHYILAGGNGSGVGSSLSIGTSAYADINFFIDGATRWTIDTSGHLITGADGVYNIGNGAGNSPANIYATSSFQIGNNGSPGAIDQVATDTIRVFGPDYVWLQGNNSQSNNTIAIFANSEGVQQAIMDQTGNFQIDGSLTLQAGQVRLQAPGNGNLLLTNFTSDGFGILQFGGQTNNYPALQINGGGLIVTLADQSALTTIQALTFQGGADLTSGTIDGVNIGYDTPGGAYFTSLQIEGTSYFTGMGSVGVVGQPFQLFDGTGFNPVTLVQDGSGVMALQDNGQSDGLNIYGQYADQSNYSRLAITTTGNYVNFNTQEGGEWIGYLNGYNFDKAVTAPTFYGDGSNLTGVSGYSPAQFATDSAASPAAGTFTALSTSLIATNNADMVLSATGGNNVFFKTVSVNRWKIDPNGNLLGDLGGGAIQCTNISSGGSVTGGARIYAKAVGGHGEMFVLDELGHETQISPHAADAPPDLYETGPGADRMERSANAILGVIKWHAKERMETLLYNQMIAQLGTPGESTAAWKDVAARQGAVDATSGRNKMVSFVTETFEQYQARTGINLYPGETPKEQAAYQALAPSARWNLIQAQAVAKSQAEIDAWQAQKDAAIAAGQPFTTPQPTLYVASTPPSWVTP